MKEFSMEFKSVNLSEEVAKYLEDIISKKPQDLGKKLPGEQALAVNFGVSRTVIREALAILRSKGLISSKNGAGSFITAPNNEDLANVVNRIVQMREIDPENLFVVRILLEVYAVEIAALMSTEEDINRLKVINKKMRKFSDDIDKRAKFDTEFHIAIAETAKNPLLAILIDTLSTILVPVIKDALQVTGTGEEGIQFHDAIINAIEEKDDKKAKSIMRQHLFEFMMNYTNVNESANYKEGEKVTKRNVLDMILIPAKVNFNPMPEYAGKYLPFAMQAGFDLTQGGRIWSCWIGGEDGPGAYLLAAYSDDHGKSWSDVQLVIDPHDANLPYPMNTHVGSFWCDPMGRMWLFYQQSFGMFDGSGANFFIRCDNPDAEKPVWSAPVYIGPGASLKKPIIASNGEWLLPVSIWERWHITEPFGDCYHELDNIRGSNVYVSTDNGDTWTYRGGVIFEDSSFNEHSIVELSDKRLMMISRCQSTIKRSYSSDFGKTWSPEEVFFKHVNSLAVIRTLPSGNLLLVKHGKTMDEVTPFRFNLTAYISKDDGQTWEGGLLLDERRAVSYPEIAWDSNGDIYVQYDYNRNTDAQLLLARFREEDVLASKPISSSAALKMIIKDINGMRK